MAGIVKIETFATSALDQLDAETPTEMEDRLNELSKQGWKVIALTTDDEGYVVILQGTRHSNV